MWPRKIHFWQWSARTATGITRFCFHVGRRGPVAEWHRVGEERCGSQTLQISLQHQLFFSLFLSFSSNCVEASYHPNSMKPTCTNASPSYAGRCLYTYNSIVFELANGKWISTFFISIYTKKSSLSFSEFLHYLDSQRDFLFCRIFTRFDSFYLAQHWTS